MSCRRVAARRPGGAAHASRPPRLPRNLTFRAGSSRASAAAPPRCRSRRAFHPAEDELSRLVVAAEVTLGAFFGVILQAAAAAAALLRRLLLDGRACLGLRPPSPRATPRRSRAVGASRRRRRRAAARLGRLEAQQRLERRAGARRDVLGWPAAQRGSSCSSWATRPAVAPLHQARAQLAGVPPVRPRITAENSRRHTPDTSKKGGHIRWLPKSVERALGALPDGGGGGCGDARRRGVPAAAGAAAGGAGAAASAPRAPRARGAGAGSGALPGSVKTARRALGNGLYSAVEVRPARRGRPAGWAPPTHSTRQPPVTLSAAPRRACP